MIGYDLFCGAGGLSLGAHLAGINIVVAIDNDRHALETYSHNFPTVHTILADVHAINSLPPNSSDNSIVFGGPPCQGFSTSNQRTRSKSNPKNWFFEDFLNVVHKINPTWVVFENVKGLLETERGYFLNAITDGLTSLGYTTSYKILNAIDFGVPQSRSRLFVVANNKQFNFEFPLPTTKKAITVAEAISDLPDLVNGANTCKLRYKAQPASEYAHILRNGACDCVNNLVTKNSDYIVKRYGYIPQGSNWESIPTHLMNNYADRSRCHTGIYRRLKNDEPSVVIGNYRKNMLIHPTSDRGLSVREAARLQSFPDWFEFKGSIGFQQQQVGNAVPPLLAKAVFLSITKYNSLS